MSWVSDSEVFVTYIVAMSCLLVNDVKYYNLHCLNTVKSIHLLRQAVGKNLLISGCYHFLIFLHMVKVECLGSLQFWEVFWIFLFWNLFENHIFTSKELLHKFAFASHCIAFHFLCHKVWCQYSLYCRNLTILQQSCHLTTHFFCILYVYIPKFLYFAASNHRWQRPSYGSTGLHCCQESAARWDILYGLFSKDVSYTFENIFLFLW